MKAFQKNSRPGSTNYVLLIDKNYKAFVSYNPDPSMGAPMFAGEGGSDETALVLDNGKGKKYYILNGDFRSHYERALAEKGLQGCIEVFNTFPNHQSTWSTGTNPEKLFELMLKNIKESLDKE